VWGFAMSGPRLRPGAYRLCGLERQLLLLDGIGLRRVLRHAKRLRQDRGAVLAVRHAELISVCPDDIADRAHRLDGEVVAIALALAARSWSVPHDRVFKPVSIAVIERHAAVRLLFSIS